MHAALCNRNCMCSTSCTKSFKKLSSLRIKLLKLEGETYSSQNKANLNDKVYTHGVLILLNILLKFRIKYRLLPIAALS